MALLLDTEVLPAHDRFDAFNATLNSAVFPGLQGGVRFEPMAATKECC